MYIFFLQSYIGVGKKIDSYMYHSFYGAISEIDSSPLESMYFFILNGKEDGDNATSYFISRKTAKVSWKQLKAENGGKSGEKTSTLTF